MESRIMKEKVNVYEGLDKLIVKFITWHPGVQVDAILANANIITELDRVAGIRPDWRVVEARLQVLRKSGLIKYTRGAAGGWRST
jgi:hypothetical protein